MANGYRPDFSFLPKTQDQLPYSPLPGGSTVGQYPALSTFDLQGGANTMFGFTPGFSAGNLTPGVPSLGASSLGPGFYDFNAPSVTPSLGPGLAPGVPYVSTDIASMGNPGTALGTYGPQTLSPTGGTLYDISTYDTSVGSASFTQPTDFAGNTASNAPTSITDTGGALQPGYANVNPDGSFSPVDTGGVGSSAPLDTGSSTSGGGGSSPVTAGPGMPVADQGLASAAQQAGTSISQAISSPLSGAIKTTGSDITGAGQTVSSGVQSAAQTASATGVGILAGLEAYVGEFFLYAAVLIAGVVFLAIGLEKFGGPKLQIAMAKR